MRPEDLAASISRLSVIQEADTGPAINVLEASVGSDQSTPAPHNNNLSNYFGSPHSTGDSIFDQLSSSRSRVTSESGAQAGFTDITINTPVKRPPASSSSTPAPPPLHASTPTAGASSTAAPPPLHASTPTTGASSSGTPGPAAAPSSTPAAPATPALKQQQHASPVQQQQQPATPVQQQQQHPSKS